MYNNTGYIDRHNTSQLIVTMHGVLEEVRLTGAGRTKAGLIFGRIRTNHSRSQHTFSSKTEL